MKAPLSALRTGLAALRVQLNVARSTLDLAETGITSTDPPEMLARIHQLQSLVRDNATEFRLHQYRSAIIALYGHLERYLESVVDLGVSRLSSLATNYRDLPGAFRDSHLNLTLEVLKKRDEPRFQGLVTTSDLLARLNGCEQGEPHFLLNSIAFTHHTANFRHDVTKAILARASFDIQAVDDSPGLTQMMRDRFPDEQRYSIINDLAQRRNEVSHGDVRNTLSMPVIFDYIDIIEAYSVAIMSCVVESLARFAIDHLGIPLGKPDQVFDSHIAGFEEARVALLVGDTLGYRRGDGRCAISRLTSLQVSGVDRQHVSAGEAIGLVTTLRCTRATDLYLMPAAVSDLEGGDLEVLTERPVAER